MTTTTDDLPGLALRTLPIRLERTGAGDPARLEAGPLSLVQYPATAAAPGPAGVFLRLLDGGRPVGGGALTGPRSGGAIGADGTVVARHGSVRARTRVETAGDGAGWTWRVTLRNDGDAPVRADLLHTLDVALAPLEDVRRNEQYIAQYLDLTPVTGEDGQVLALAVRQNMPAAAVPWAALGCSAGIGSWATDALQLLDRAEGAGLDLARDLPSERLQHEHTLAALRTAPLDLAPGEERTVDFWGFVLADHPEATGPQDAATVRAGSAALGLPECPVPDPAEPVRPVPASVLALAPELPVLPAGQERLAALADGPLRLRESDADGIVSAFGPAGHVVTAAKERRVLRPHGHIQQVSASATPDLAVVASTVWMRGVFCSQLTVGHASADPLTGIRRSYLGLDPVGGVRILRRDVDGTWGRLGVPSAWRTDPVGSEWLYLLPEGSLRIRSVVELPGTARIQVTAEGPAADLLVSVDAAPELDLRATADGRDVGPGDDAPLFLDDAPHGTGLRTLELTAVREAEVVLGGAPSVDISVDISVDPGAAEAYVPRLPALRRRDRTRAQEPDALGDQAAVVDEMLAWLAQNAAVHFRSPRGLEQFTGGAWGTRDVCQGPVGLLLATDEHAVVRSTLLQVFGAQQEDGTWPQWFDYLPGFAGPGLRDSHGDVVYWPLRTLAEYLEVTGDASLLAEPAPWVGAETRGAPTTVLDHVRRAVRHIGAQRTEDPRLPAYGHGDWNDSLQPARPELAQKMCSTWTTELEIAALGALATALAAVGGAPDEAPVEDLVARCRALAAGAEEALAELLLVDDELAGYALLEDGAVRHLVHPRDETTGLRHGSLQMIHAIADELLTPEQARHHLGLLDAHLAGPTGLYLFDRPAPYHGGVMEVFQRAETATFWGREIGLMYMHAHLRWIEALTHLGESERAWQELLKAVPIGLPERVRGARVRQSISYYSSSDAVFPDRRSAAENAERLFDAATGFEGGWRVYSSGPGLLLRMVVEDVLGVRVRAAGVEIDPVLPAELDDTEARIPLDGGFATVRYRVGATGCGVASLQVDGMPVALDGTEDGVVRLERRYRDAGVRLAPGRVRDGSVLEVVTG